MRICPEFKLNGTKMWVYCDRCDIRIIWTKTKQNKAFKAWSGCKKG